MKSFFYIKFLFTHDYYSSNVKSLSILFLWTRKKSDAVFLVYNNPFPPVSEASSHYFLTQLSRWSFSVVKDISSVRSLWACSDLILWSSRLRTHSEVVHLGLMWPHSFSGVNRNVLKEHLHNWRPLKQEEAIPAMGYVLWVTVMWMACSLWYSLTCQRLEAERTKCSNC